MYWIYFTIFMVVVFVPAFIRNGFYGLPEEAFEQVVILLLGFLGFLLFIAQRKKVIQSAKEKIQLMRESNRMSKDLTSSYSYIGEINRKLDILKNIALGLPEAASFTPEKEKEIYSLIMDAIRVLGKSQSFAIRFIRTSDRKVLKELLSRKNASIKLNGEECLTNKHILEKDDSLIITSHHAIEDLVACIFINKQRKSYAHEDLELIEAIASQALFVFVFARNKKSNNRSNNQSND